MGKGLRKSEFREIRIPNVNPTLNPALALNPVPDLNLYLTLGLLCRGEED
jgi:hypothetical protein